MTIATAIKKLLVAVLTDEKGRKVLLYTVGIALFVMCIPLITLLGLFGWMSAESDTILDQNAILAELPSEHLEMIQTLDEVSGAIADAFTEANLSEEDCKKATAIYMAYLVGMETEDGFNEKLASCFQNATEEAGLYDLILQTFQVEISEEDQMKFDSLYGQTPLSTEGEEE